jgi:hypothetical protein
MDKDRINYSREPRLISYPGWSKSDYIKHHGVQNGTIAWLENENRIMKEEMLEMKRLIANLEKKIN